MQDIISILKKESLLNKHKNFKIKEVESDNCAVIIEPRQHEMLEPVIRNVMRSLMHDHGNFKVQTWNLHVFCGDKNHEYIKELFPDWQFKITNLGVSDLDKNAYSELLKSKEFWDKIDQENVLIFQTDSFTLNGFDINNYTDFSFIGSPYNWDPEWKAYGERRDKLTPPECVSNINGGFSFRKKSSMLDCIENVSTEDIIKWREDHGSHTTYFKIPNPWMSELPEDVYFHNALSMLKYKLPTHEECANFCHQHSYNEETEKCRAIHGYDKYCAGDEELKLCRRHQSDKPIAFIYAGYAHEKFNGADYSGKRGVRGSEIGLINLAENLTSRFDVYVAGGGILEGSHKNVTYFGEEKIDIFLKNARVDTLIINRYIHYFLEHKVQARTKYVWVQDVGLIANFKGNPLPHDGGAVINNCLDKITGFVCLSDPHIELFKEIYDIPNDKIYKIGNGLINSQHFRKNIDKISNRFVYNSLPERGLDILLNWFPDIKRELPDAELHVFTDLDITNSEHTPEEYKRKMDDIDGVIFRGKVSNEVMLDEFMMADVWLYPNIFFETFCTSALEAQAAGCLVVTREYGALKEVVSDRGIMIDGDPYSEEFKQKALIELFDALKNPEKKQNLQKRAKEWALQKTWGNRSLEWVDLLQK